MIVNNNFQKMAPYSTKLDPHNSKIKYESLKQKLLTESCGLSSINSQLLLNFLEDLRQGVNTSSLSKRGSRSFIRIVACYYRLLTFFRFLEAKAIKDITETTEKDLSKLITDIEQGKIKKMNGEAYKSAQDFLRDFKVFWHWHIKRNKEIKPITDITSDIGTVKSNAPFVHFTLDELLNTLFPYFNIDERTVLLFIFDSIIRSPTELMNLKGKDFHDNCKTVKIRDEISKTYGRTITLFLSADMVQEYIQRHGIGDEDYVFKFSYDYFSYKLKQAAITSFGNVMTKGGAPYSNLSLYDFRHSGAIYWRLGKYKNNIDALMYRGGWSNLERLNYYTKTIGMSDLPQESAAESNPSSEAQLLSMLQKQDEKIDSMMTLVMQAIGSSRNIQRRLPTVMPKIPI